MDHLVFKSVGIVVILGYAIFLEFFFKTHEKQKSRWIIMLSDLEKVF